MAEMGMTRAGVAAVIGFFVLTAQGVAPAQTIPLPQPAPKARTAPAAAAKPATPSLADSIGTEAGQHALVDRVSLYLSTIQTMVGNFVQVGPDGRKTEGKFYIAKPGRVRFEYNPPSPIEVVADGSQVVVHDRRLDTKDLYPLSQTPLRFLLADRIDLWNDTKVVSVGADEKYVTVSIEERTMIIGTSKLMMMFNAKDFQLLQWTVTDPQGYETTVGVYNLDMKQKPDPNMFRIVYGRAEQNFQ
jgi:outer membrane lipoprotein-sorting protein